MILAPKDEVIERARLGKENVGHRQDLRTGL